MNTSIIHKFVLLIATICTTFSVSAYDFEVDGIYYEKISDTSVEVTNDGNLYDDNSAGYSGNVTIPETIDINGITYFVCGIGRDAFYGCAGLTSVTIPASVTSIGVDAFSSCPGLTEIVINGNNPNYASNDGVLFNKAYTELIRFPAGKAGIYNIPEGVTSIVLSAFSGCSGLTSVTIPEGVTSIGNYAFSGCTGLSSVTIPEGATSIGNFVFMGCIGLTSVSIPASVTSIVYSVFLGCTGLTEIIINENNPKYASIDGVLFNKTYTELILYPAAKAGIYNIPEGVASIGYSAFEDCTGLISVTIPASVTSIGDFAFSGCTGLTSVIIPEGVTSIGDFAFYYCMALNRVICFAETVPTFGYKVFAEVPTTCSFYVPSGTGGSYASAKELASYTIKELGLTVTPAEVTLEVGATAELTASYTVDGAAETETEISSVLGSEFIWSSSDENVAAVSTSGQITARNAGTAEIKAITRFGNTVFATSNVNVGTSGILDVSANGIKISAASGKIMVENLGENQKVSAYTIDGVCHILQGSNDGTVEIPAETGKIYIIVIDGFATKVIAK